MATKSEHKRKPPSSSSHWSYGLVTLKDDPSKHLDSNDQCIIIQDGYPKGHHHYLVLPREDIPSIGSLTIKHVPLLENMLEFAKVYLTKRHGPNYDGIVFRFGYHAVPSMRLLHMHIISQDFDSPCLKNKKHWNSFTTEFFLDADKVIKLIREQGQLKIDKEYYESLLKGPLCCHVCRQEQRNIPTLKEHIKTHIVPH